MNEKVIFVKLMKDQNNEQEAKLYVRWGDENLVYLALWSTSLFVEKSGSTYIDCLLETMKQLPYEAKLKFQNKLQVVKEGDISELVVIEEFVSLTYLKSIEDYHLQFELYCTFNGVQYEAHATEDFSIALQRLKDKIGLEFKICAYCSNADFKSYGGEDLRHGFYCFREVEGRNTDLPWFQREEEFERAIPNLNAFHWCPMYQNSEKTYI